ncbi:hypothetical protein J2S46_002744 [Kitasatospora herbaricolor]|uniref:hypothetical protein n=1 Tax=Kitasatospora herbaricolor TaxID=68217 RepID=UPI001748AE54|nr:hypothetical protein [Kitasatospora herbaricolor]MDQ0308188.1 hypothetical protein [Kitasatospora herbaricolor]
MTRTTGTAVEAADAPSGTRDEGREPAAPGGPWEVRRSGGGGGHRRGRPALEVYEHGELLDVLVLSRLSARLLRGARRSTDGGRRLSFAWGRLPAHGPVPVVEFSAGRLPLRRRARLVAPAVTVSGVFWLAWAEGPFSTVTVRDSTGEAPAERLPLVRSRSRTTGAHGGDAA